jgi:hypothetical protein
MPTTLRPARLWKFPDEELSKGNQIKAGVTSGWYSVKNKGLNFLGNSATDVDTITWMQSAIYWGSRDPNIFMELCIDNDWDQASRETGFLKQSWVHREMQKILEKGRPWNYSPQQRKLYNYVAFALPRGFGKTTQIIGSILYELGKNPNTRIKLVAETNDIAKQRVYEVKTHIERNGYLHSVFPKLKGAAIDQWTHSKIYVDRPMLSRDASLQAFGVLEAGTGGRADILIGDDVVGRRNSLTQPKLREEVKSAWFSSWLPQLTRDGRCWYIFTPWHLNDLSHTLVTREQFLTMLVTVGLNFESPWPEFLSQKDLKEKYGLLSPIEFARAYWLEAANDSDSPVNEIYVQYTDADDIEGDDWEFLISLDLAVGEAAGDCCALVVFAVSRKKKVAIVVDTYNGHDDIIGQIALIKSWSETYKPSWIVIESVAYQKSFYKLLKQNEDLKSFRGNLYTYLPTVSKRLRIEMTVPNIKSGKVRFLRELSPHAIDGKKKGQMLRQLVDFGIEDHDDLADAFTQGVLFLETRLHFWNDTNQTGIRITSI